MNYKIAKISILTLFFLSFYLQNRYAIFSIDDWNYAFIVNEDADNYQSVANDNVVRQPIVSIYSAILSQSRDYFKTNGRFIIHTLVQYICGTKTMLQFVFLNSLIFIAFTLLIIKLSSSTPNIWNLFFILSSIWILLPHKGLTFMGNVTCSVDYLWSSVGTLLFIFFFIRIKNHDNNYCSPILLFIMIVYSIIAGSLQESFSIGVSGALILYILFKRKNISRRLLAISLSYIIGTIICMSTPANFRRFDDIGGGGFHSNSLLGILSSPVIIIFVGIIIVLIRKKEIISIFKNNYFIVTPIFILLLFAIFVAYNGRHQLTAINVFCLIFIIRMWNKYLSVNLKRTISIILSLIALISYYPILQTRKEYYVSYQTLLQRIYINNNNGIVSGKEFESNTIKIRKNRILECNYVATFTFQDWDFFEKSLSIHLSRGKNNQLVEEITK